MDRADGRRTAPGEPGSSKARKDASRGDVMAGGLARGCLTTADARITRALNDLSGLSSNAPCSDHSVTDGSDPSDQDEKRSLWWLVPAEHTHHG